MADRHLTAALPAQDPPPRSTWQGQWQAVPSPWRQAVYPVNDAPFDEVFTRPGPQSFRAAHYDFRPTGAGRLGEEIAWWVHTCWREGLRKIDPTLLKAYTNTLSAMAHARTELTGRAAVSVTDFDPALIVRHATQEFSARNGRAPSAGWCRNFTSLAEHLHLFVSVRCSEQPWFRHDTWDLRVDSRIPRREHEPAHDASVRLAGIEPGWLREGLRYWLRVTLTAEIYTWTSVISRSIQLGAYFGRFAAHTGLSHPAITTDPGRLRPILVDFLAYLRSPQAGSRGGRLSQVVINSVQSQLQAFYTFMFDNAGEAADVTGDPRWRDLTVAHTRLFGPQHRSRRSGNGQAPRWISTTDLQRMLCCLEILGAPSSRPLTVTLPGGETLTAPGKGDEQAMRVWLLQAMTGRRASEILMLDFEPLEAVPGLNVEEGDAEALVARLRYQQTKIDGVEPTILVEQTVVNIIREQQEWVRAKFPEADPRYLFLNPRHNHKGLRARSYRSYLDALRRLDRDLNLTDAQGQPLRFSNTHRLRHTRATELINAGVPVHVVQRYLGHRSPEMTMRYAATLADVAEAEFLKFKKLGADGRSLDIHPKDLLELAQLDRRTDRILPNGWCLLPPTKDCDKGNACLTCTHFATDATHADELQQQKRQTLDLIEVRQAQFTERTGTPMGDNHIWLSNRRRELHSIDAILSRLTSQNSTGVVRGAGVSARTDTEDDPHEEPS